MSAEMVQLPSGFAYDPEARSVILPLQEPNLPEAFWSQVAREGKFMPKEEFHVTLIARSIGEMLTPKMFQKILDKLTDAPELKIDLAPVVYRVTDRKEAPDGILYDREALVQPLYSGDLDGLFAGLLPAELKAPKPFWHVTLASYNDGAFDYRGIGIGSAKEWRGLTKFEYNDTPLMIRPAYPLLSRPNEVQ